MIAPMQPNHLLIDELPRPGWGRRAPDAWAEFPAKETGPSTDYPVEPVTPFRSHAAVTRKSEDGKNTIPSKS